MSYRNIATEYNEWSESLGATEKVICKLRQNRHILNKYYQLPKRFFRVKNSINKSFDSYISEISEGTVVGFHYVIDCILKDIELHYSASLYEDINAEIILVKAAPYPPNGGSVALKDFYIGKYAVTFKEWKHVRNWAIENGFEISEGKGLSERHPITDINLYDAIKWCNAKSILNGFLPVYYERSSASCLKTGEDFYMDTDATGYRIPLKEECEWAAKGGEGSTKYNFEFSGSNDINKVAWFDGNSDNIVHEVGKKKPNLLGIYDLSGNVSEWCHVFKEDAIYGARYGGSFRSNTEACKVNNVRLSDDNSARDLIFGFRLARWVSA